MSILGICEWIDGTALSRPIRQSVWLFPIVETVHLFGIAGSAATILFVDLRLLGIGLKRERLSDGACHGPLNPASATSGALMRRSDIVHALVAPLPAGSRRAPSFGDFRRLSVFSSLFVPDPGLLAGRVEHLSKFQTVHLVPRRSVPARLLDYASGDEHFIRKAGSSLRSEWRTVLPQSCR
jgi:hypothetical protein